jgi:hypothetical protein
MKKSTLLVFALLGIFSPAYGTNRSRGPLTEKDWQMEAKDRLNGPILTAAPGAITYWESYNQWLCFPATALQVLRVDTFYEDQKKSLPQIDIEWAGHLFQISIDPDRNLDFDDIAFIWRKLIRNAEDVCVYAAYLQKMPSTGSLGSSLWIVDRLKTEKGEWTRP